MSEASVAVLRINSQLMSSGIGWATFCLAWSPLRSINRGIITVQKSVIKYAFAVDVMQEMICSCSSSSVQCGLVIQLDYVTAI